MKSKHFAIVTTLFALILALAMIGGTWTTSSARGTVPEKSPDRGHSHLPSRPPYRPPHRPHLRLIPVTGACAGEELEKVGNVELCMADGSLDRSYEVNFEVATIVPAAGKIAQLTPPFSISLVNGNRVTTDYKFGEDAALTVELPTDVLDQYKKNDLASLMWYNSQSAKWEKIPATVEDGLLTAMVSRTGLFILAIPK